MTDIETTAPQADATQDQAELNERDLDQVAGGLNFTRTEPKPAAVDY